MAGPKLLPKKQVNTEVAAQKKQQIIEGITLAKKIDTLRTTLGDEESRLEKFRTESIAQIQREIDFKIKEREVLEIGNQKLKEEQLLAQAPIDLKEEWLKVREDSVTNQTWHENLVTQQVSLIAREASSVAFDKDLKKRDVELKQKESLVERTLFEAEEKFNSASDILINAQKKSEEMVREAKERERYVLIREQEAKETYEGAMRIQEENRKKELDLSNRERALTDKYETFVRAQNYVKSVKKKKK